MIRMEAWQSIYKSVSKYFRNEKLRQVFSFHPLLIGGDPSAVTCVYSLIAALEKGMVFIQRLGEPERFKCNDRPV